MSERLETIRNINGNMSIFFPFLLPFPATDELLLRYVPAVQNGE